MPVPVFERRKLPTPVPVESLPAWAPVKNSMKRGHVLVVLQLVPSGVRILSRMTLFPELSVESLFDTVRIAVPVAEVGAVIDPMMETMEEGRATFTLSGPLNDDVAVEVEMTLPARNCPYAVVEASNALDVALRLPNMPVNPVALTNVCVPRNVLLRYVFGIVLEASTK